MSLSKRLALDLAAATAVPFLSIWAYEGANWIAMSIQGYPVSLTVSGGLPLGVAAVTSGGISILTKGLQVALAISLLVPFGLMFGKMKLFVSRTLVVSMAGVFIASSYWEMLSAGNAGLAEVHTVTFIASASAMSLVTLWAFDRSRRLHPAIAVPTRS